MKMDGDLFLHSPPPAHGRAPIRQSLGIAASEGDAQWRCFTSRQPRLLAPHVAWQSAGVGSADGGDQKSQDVMSCNSESALPLAWPILAHMKRPADIGCKSRLLRLPFPLGLSPVTSPYPRTPSSDRSVASRLALQFATQRSLWGHFAPYLAHSTTETNAGKGVISYCPGNKSIFPTFIDTC